MILEPVRRQKGEDMNQRERIVRYLKDNGSITAYEAVKELGILQLASRLGELEGMGYTFDRQRISKKNRYGETVTFMRYSFPKESEVK